MGNLEFTKNNAVNYATPLMNSRTIARELRGIAAGDTLNTAQLSVVFGLVFTHPEYENSDIDSVVTSIRQKSEPVLTQLARKIHPVLCSLQLDKDELSGGEYWRAQRVGPRGVMQAAKALHLRNGRVYAG